MKKNSIAFGAPGIEPRWTSSAKDGIRTAYHSASHVWFMLSHGNHQRGYSPPTPYAKRSRKIGNVDVADFVQVEEHRRGSLAQVAVPQTIVGKAEESG